MQKFAVQRIQAVGGLPPSTSGLFLPRRDPFTHAAARTRLIGVGGL